MNFNKEFNIEDYFDIHADNAFFKVDKTPKKMIRANQLLDEFLMLPFTSLEGDSLVTRAITLNEYIQSNYNVKRRVLEESRLIKHENHPNIVYRFRDYVSVGTIELGSFIIGVAKINTVMNPIADLRYFNNYSEIPNKKEYVISGGDSELFLKSSPEKRNDIIEIYLTPKAFNTVSLEDYFLYALSDDIPNLVIEPRIITYPTNYEKGFEDFKQRIKDNTENY
jgi:hypothetical protein